VDGSVEIDAEGSEINMDKFLGLLKKGNRFSHVEDILLYEIKEFENYKGFSIED
jgi:acylphosphatase